MLKGIIPGPEQLTKKAVMMALTVPEGVVMLTIAVFFDAAGIILFILSLCGVGIPLSWLLTIVGTITIGFWVATRSLFRGAIERAVGNITEKMLNVGGGLEGVKKFQGASAPGLEAGKKVTKTGAKVSLSAVRLIICFIIELIPFVNNLFPAWTFLVIFELVQGEL
ncbi:MAG: hypothetical protein C0412_09320 [Flavobacterium sp.]|nr:hypothetical protein [Flavobacterium sp.]